MGNCADGRALGGEGEEEEEESCNSQFWRMKNRKQVSVQ